RLRLISRSPWRAVSPCEHEGVTGAAARPFLEERYAFIAQFNVARLAALALTNGDRAGIGIEIAGHQPAQFAVSRASHKRGLNEQPKVRIRSVDQSLRFGDSEIALPRPV